jgi:hypothetical protein
MTGSEFVRVVLVTGGRDFNPGPGHYGSLASYLLPGSILIHGACPTGADYLADEFALGLGFIPVEDAAKYSQVMGFIKRFPADWNAHGKAAGPIRNKEMLDWALQQGKPITVLAFPGGRGTKSMVDLASSPRAQDAGVEVIYG